MYYFLAVGEVRERLSRGGSSISGGKKSRVQVARRRPRGGDLASLKEEEREGST